MYDDLGDSLEEKLHAYRELFKTQLPDEDLHAIKESMKFNYPLGNERFKMQVEAALGRTAGEKRRGRPKASVDIG